MTEFLVLLSLVLALTVVQRLVVGFVPTAVPAPARILVSVILASGVAWALDYSVFAALGQDLREAWMHPVATGFVLVAFGEFVRSLVDAIARRDTGSVADGTPQVA